MYNMPEMTNAQYNDYFNQSCDESFNEMIQEQVNDFFKTTQISGVKVVSKFANLNHKQAYAKGNVMAWVQNGYEFNKTELSDNADAVIESVRQQIIAIYTQD